MILTDSQKHELPDELWLQILVNTHRATGVLASLCLVNRQLYHIAVPWLYSTVTHFANFNALMAFLHTTCQQPRLAQLVHSLDLEYLFPAAVVGDDATLRLMQEALEQLTNLKRLLVPGGYPSNIFSRSKFQLESLTCAFDCDAKLEAFWRTQHTLREMHIFGYPNTSPSGCHCRADSTILPSLAVLRANAAWLAQLAPFRPSLRTIEALDGGLWLPVNCPPGALDGVNMLIITDDGLNKNYSVLSRLSVRLDVLVVTNLALSYPRRLLNALSESRAIQPSHLGLQVQTTVSPLDMLEVTLAMHLKSAPRSLKSLNVSYSVTGAEVVEQWRRHPEQEDTWQRYKVHNGQVTL